MKRIGMLPGLMMMLMLSGCIGTVVGAAVDVTTAVIKAPFQIGGAVVDAVSDDDEEESPHSEDTASSGN
ncbi:MAG: threonine dehydratase [Zetaproteobacteria bacterium CG12_big_fil_rev_8_21_14_0_65_54_13]|nr:MAG: threonine dehydratase [Zetaproteobacteria bacterium CG12_big_fil_rev_8_21_14_0_65_54_13]PIX55659.1 MAG: threonine dehydratase [Zetaproteobacteria bacterium CG_4_10_14_3_um_filter_54_28]PJA30667.1 MAG: threonine dehydratase [Zetaproteobacteria bacterium CG_4_9_14_3_um_filter_54_145]